MPRKDNLGELAEYIAANDWRKVEEHFSRTGLSAHMGIQISLKDPEKPKCVVADVQPFHLGGVGQAFVNGAVISGMMDLAIGLTALKYSHQGAFATTNLHIDLARPVANGTFYCISECDRVIGKKLFSIATIYDCFDEPCIYASGTVRIGIDTTS